MGNIVELFTGPAQASVPGPSDDFWYDDEPSVAATGAVIDEDVATTVSTYYACVRIISETIASLPIHCIASEPGSEGRTVKTRRDDLPFMKVLRETPNGWQTPFEFVEMLTGHAVNRGNAFAFQRGNDILGAPDEFIPLNPSKMEVALVDGRLSYTYTKPNGQREPLRQEQVMHLRGFGSDGVRGLSTISLMRDAVGLAKATEIYGSRFFTGSAHPRGVLEMESKLDPDVHTRLKRSWDRTYGNRIGEQHKVVILEQGMSWKQVGISNEDSQFLETRKFSVQDIARFFRVPPHLLQDLERATFSNIEQQAIEFVMHTIRPWVVRWEQVLTRAIVPEALRPTHSIKFSLEGLLRGDFKTRMEGYQIAVNTGLLSPNEVRELEDRNPYDGGDEHRRPSTMQTDRERVPAGDTGDEDEDAPPRRRRRRIVRDQQEDDDQGRAWALAIAGASAVLNKEELAIARHAPRHASDPEGWAAWCEEFYREHEATVRERLALSAEAARAWCEQQRDIATHGGVDVVQSWRSERLAALARIAAEDGR